MICGHVAAMIPVENFCANFEHACEREKLLSQCETKFNRTGRKPCDRCRRQLIKLGCYPEAHFCFEVLGHHERPVAKNALEVAFVYRIGDFEAIRCGRRADKAVTEAKRARVGARLQPKMVGRAILHTSEALNESEFG